MTDKKDSKDVPSLNRLMAEVNRKWGPNTIGQLGKMPEMNVKRLSTGVTGLDLALGGGFPLGRMVELYGIPSSGKSLITLLSIKQAQIAKLDCIYVDAEGSFDPLFAQSLGVDTDKLVIMKLSQGEDIFDIIAYLLKTEPGVVVIDSVAAMITEPEMEASLKDQQMAIKARLMSKALAKINALNKKTLFLFINQLRSTLTMYGAPTTTTGGRALGHYASIRVEVKQGEKLTVDNKKTGDVIGQVVQYKINKNKTAAPFKYGAFKFYYDGAKIEEE